MRRHEAQLLRRKGEGGAVMQPRRTRSTVTVGTSPVTLMSFSPSGNWTIELAYLADSLGLTSRGGKLQASGDKSDNIDEFYDNSTLDNVDYLTAPGAATAALGTAASCTAGDHIVKVTFVTAAGETTPGTASNTVTVTAANERINLTGIPVSTDAACTSRKIYMTEAGGATYKLVDTITNNTATTYSITIADGSLGATAPTANTSALPDTSYLTFGVSSSAGVVSITATSTSGSWTVATQEISRIIL